MNAVAGRRPETVKIEPFRFDQMRPGCYDPDARVRDMDIGGDLGVAQLPVDDHRVLRARVLAGRGPASSASPSPSAWNDWMYEEWWQPHPERFIPLGIT